MTAKPMTATKKKKKARPAWWPKRVSAAEWSDLDNQFGGLCLSCGAIAYGCEPDMEDGPCEHCEEENVVGAEDARIRGALVVDEDEPAAPRVELPPAPAPSAAPEGCVRARGRLRHRFWGEYSAVIALEFGSVEQARAALPVLAESEPWHLSREPRCLVAVVNRTALDRIKLQLWRFGADEKAIDSCRTSIDYGEPFTVDVPVGAVGAAVAAQEEAR